MKQAPATVDDGGASLRKARAAEYKQAIEELSWLAGHEYDLVCKGVRERFDVHASTVKAAVQRERSTRRAKNERAKAAGVQGPTLDDFVAYMPTHVYIFLPTMEPWVGASVDALFPPVPVDGSDGEYQPASRWLDKNRSVAQITWLPGEPALVKDVVITDRGSTRKPGYTTLNRYQPPLIVPVRGDVSPWLNHLDKILPDDANHILGCFAHCVQRPAVKINHALVLGGSPGIGKDTLLEPLVSAVGPGNFADIAPNELMGQWTEFARSVAMRINEVHDLGDTDRFKFYERTKRYCVAPPSTLKVNEKHLRQYYVPNVCFPIMTTNHKTDGLYLPADDRRHYVAWSKLTSADFPAGYWDKLHSWYDNGGSEIVAEYLHTLDLKSLGFDPKAPPRKTEAFWEIVGASAVPEDAEMQDALARLDSPAAVTLDTLAGAEGLSGFSGFSGFSGLSGLSSFTHWLRDRSNRRKIPHRLESCGYTAVRNHAAKDGLWVVNGKRQMVYARDELNPQERQLEAQKLAITEV